MKLIPTLCVLGLLAIVTFTPQADTIVVDPNGGGDALTIQGGVSLATNGDIVYVLPGLYQENVIVSAKSITLRAAGGPAVTTIDGRNYESVVFVQSASSFQLSGFTLTHGLYSEYGGGLRVTGVALLEVKDCWFVQNYASDGGGGLFVPTGTNASIEACRFDDNGTDYEAGEGGGICVRSGVAQITGCHFTGNSARRGGGVSCYWTVVLIDECTFVGNDVSRGGGGVFTAGGDVTVRRSAFVHNTAYRGGGGFQVSEGGLPVVESNTFAFNESPWPFGGAVQMGTGSHQAVIRGNIMYGSPHYGVHAIESVSIQFECNDVFANELGNYGGALPDLTGQGGNFSEDPQFCDPQGDDFALCQGSPCVPGQHPQGVPCGWIGCYEIGCGPSPTEEITWGGLKARFLR